MGKIRNLHDSHETKSVARSSRLTLRFWSLRIVSPKIQSRRHPNWERYFLLGSVSPYLWNRVLSQILLQINLPGRVDDHPNKTGDDAGASGDL